MTAARGKSASRGLMRNALKTLLWFLAISLLFNAFFGDMGIIQAVRQRRTAARLQRHLQTLRVANESLRAEIGDLRRNPFRIEAIAREELGLSRPGEIIFLFQNSWSEGNGEEMLPHP